MFSRFSKTLTYDGWMDRHTTTANILASQRRAGKNWSGNERY